MRKMAGKQKKPDGTKKVAKKLECNRKSRNLMRMKAVKIKNSYWKYRKNGRNNEEEDHKRSDQAK